VAYAEGVEVTNAAEELEEDAVGLIQWDGVWGGGDGFKEVAAFAQFHDFVAFGGFDDEVVGMDDVGVVLLGGVAG